jgi:hypothetical protein
VSDWYDRGECHTRNPHQLSGRIYKVSFGERRPPPPDLAKLSDAELMELQFHKNDWIVTRARRLLQERRPKGVSWSLKSCPDRAARLRAIWAMHVTGNLGEPADLQRHDDDEYVRAWGLRLDLEDGEAFRRETLLEMAKTDPSPVVRLHLASACQRMPIRERFPILEALAQRMEDVDDPNLPLMVWYALEPWVAENRAAAVELMKKPLLPPLREFITRRLVAR